MKTVIDLLPTRRSLLSRLKNWQDNESWTTFFDTYWRLIYTTAIKAGLTETEAEDVVQETVFSVCKSIPQFKYDPACGSFKSWLLKLTAWRIGDQMRKRNRRPELPQASYGEMAAKGSLEAVPDPAYPAIEAVWDEEWENNLFEAAIERVKRKVDSKHYQAFDLSVLREWPVPRVADALKMSRASVYVARHRVNL